MTLVVAGIACGIPAALALSRLLTSFLYEIHPNDLWTFSSVPILLGGVAVVAALLPALRASRIDPVRTLRLE